MQSVQRFFEACQGTEPIQVELTPKQGGSTIVVEYEKPFILVGRAAGADMGFENTGTALRQLYFQLIAGRLFAIQLSEEFPTSIGQHHWEAGWVSSEDRYDISEASLVIKNPVQKGAPPVQVIDPTASTPQGRVLYSLECGLGSSRIKRIPNSRQILLIGRSTPAKLRVKDRTLCPIHAALVNTGSSNWIVDLSFEGGVTINDEVVAFAELQPGDVFNCGRVPFRLLKPNEATPERNPIVQVRNPVSHVVTPTVSAPTYPHSEALAPDHMTPVLEELAKFQSHSFEQFREILGTVMQMVGIVLSEQRSFVKDELDRMERMMMMMVKAQGTVPVALPQTNGPASNPAPQAVQQGTTPPPISMPTAPPRPEAPPPSGLNDVVLHSWVEQQLQSLQVEQESLWQRVKRSMTGNSPTAT
jgi:hypothetical protein